MRRRQLLLLAPALVAAVAATSASASEEKKKDTGGQYVDIAPIALPIVVDHRLVNYVFVSVRLNLTASADATKLRGKEPYFRDALVRAGHRTPFTNPRDYTVIDTEKLKATLMREATAIAGPRSIVSVTVTSQTPKQRSGLPRPPA